MKKITLLFVINFITMLSCFSQFDEKFYFPSKEWQNIEGIDFTEIYFSIDNDTINTILFKSTDTTKATIIYFHGTGGNISSNTYIAELLTHEGFQVFMIDFRGYGKSTGKPTHLNIANDAQVIFDKIKSMNEFKNLPIIIIGASLGTQIATKITRDNETEISALILDGTMSSFTDLAKLSVSEDQKDIISTYVTSPYSAEEDIKYIKSTPKLFIHSKFDKYVPFNQGNTVFSNATEPKTFWEYEGNHLDSASKFPKEYIQYICFLLEESKNYKKTD